MLRFCWISVFTLLLIFGCEKQQPAATQTVQTGLDRVAEFTKLFAGKRVGIVTNHTAYDANNAYIFDIINNLPDVTVTAMFGPEHGIRGQAEDGAPIYTKSDPLNDVPIYSLYGQTRKPTAEMMENVDVLVFDIQDIGARYYTYIYTMAYAMEAAAEFGKPFVVLDRPNPITGSLVEGNILDTAFATFVGRFPMPVRHGMTVGELAKMFNGEGWLGDGLYADLTIIPMKNWKRNMWFDETGQRFIKPSPNMPSLLAETTYPGTCLIEGTNFSEGRGTPTPFEHIGAPWVNGKELADKLNALKLRGVTFVDTTFTPIPIPGAATNPKLRDRECGAVRLNVTDRNAFQPYRTGIHIINAIYQLYSDSLEFRVAHFDRLCGTDKIRLAIQNGEDMNKLIDSWQDDLENFLVVRQKYLIYE
ncbi:MAG: DUF1343 domain-containing protein [Calditrichaeota bacterium]|nr:DUF1343 domain-containing protein [Calditrichota bacterium]